MSLNKSKSNAKVMCAMMPFGIKFQTKNRLKIEQKYHYTCARMFCFLVIPVWSIAVRFVAGVGASSKSAALIELSLARAASAC